MLIWVLLVVFFWAVVPGLITGWMRRERGRSFFPGLLLGAVFGPFGILTTLAFIYFAERSAARRRRPKHGRAVRVFYDIPVVGRLHVSTVWALAGVATSLRLAISSGMGGGRIRPSTRRGCRADRYSTRLYFTHSRSAQACFEL